MSRYQFEQIPGRSTTAYRLRDTARQAEAVIYPEYGANCVSFRTTPERAHDTDAFGEPVDVLVPPDQVEDLQRSPFYGGTPILFPFPNRVREGTYTFEGRTHRMEKLLSMGWDSGAGQAIHGLVADKVWGVESVYADRGGVALRCFLQLDSDPEIFAQYPYLCRLIVTYTLCEGALGMQIEVVNTGKTRLPMGFGIHPWFPTRLHPELRLPEALGRITAQQRARAEVRIPADALWELDRFMPTGKILPVEADAEMFDLRTPRPLDARTYDHVFTRVKHDAGAPVTAWPDTPSIDIPREEKGSGSEAMIRDPDSGLEAALFAGPGFREWVFYAPEDRPVVSLEPYTCATDAVNLAAQGIDAGLIALPGGDKWRGEIGFRLRRTRRA